MNGFKNIGIRVLEDLRHIAPWPGQKFYSVHFIEDIIS